MKKGAFTLVELILYITLLAIMLIGITTFLMTNIERHVRGTVAIDLGKTLLTVTDRIAREISKGVAIQTAESIFDDDAGHIVVVAADGTKIEIERDEEKNIQYTKGNEPTIVLHKNSIEATKLRFINLSTPKSFPAIRAEITLAARNPSESAYLTHSISSAITISLPNQIQ